VEVDNRGGMRALVSHVLRVKPAGPLLYLDGPQESPDAAARATGLREALGPHGEAQVVPAHFSHDGGFTATAQFLTSARPGAVVAANDQSALGALDALRAASVQVPHDCVVTGFDGIDAGRYSSPTLTTV